MKNKIISLIICLLMTTTVFSVVGFSVEAEDDTNFNIAPPTYNPATPGDVSNPLPNTLVDMSMVRKHPEKTTTTMNDIIISILEQVDEILYLKYLENLTKFGPRVTGSVACGEAADYIYNQFHTMGLPVRYHHWKVGGYEADNIEATINGTDESSDEIYIICAHYDTVSPSPGADDDGSGTVAVLIAAFIMSQYHYQFNHTIKFVAFSGEEQGLLGSRIYAINATNEGWNIMGVFNADMISYAETTADGDNLIVFQNDASEWLYNYTFDISVQYTDYIDIILHNGGFTWGSDHYYFWDAGYDALFFYEYTTTPYYHTSGDTIAHINATYAVKNVRLILATLADIAEVSTRNNPPAIPVLTGPAKGTINQAYNLSIITTEPDGEEIYYLVDWGDGQVDEWAGPYTSNTTVVFTHQWNTKGTYTIKAKARDINRIESTWGSLNVVMPKNYSFSFQGIPQNLLIMLTQRFSSLWHFINN